MKHFLLSTLVFALLSCGAFASLAALAEGTEQAGDPAFSRKDMVDAKGRKIQVVNFEDAVIEGAARAPEGFVLQSRQGATFRSVVDLRREFRSQIEVSGAGLAPIVPISP